MALSTREIHGLRSSAAGTPGNKVAKAIELAEVTQVQVAAATGLPQPYVSDVARGRYQTITVENAHKLADYFGCSIEDLFPARETVGL